MSSLRHAEALRVSCDSSASVEASALVFTNTVAMPMQISNIVFEKMTMSEVVALFVLVGWHAFR